MSATVGVTKGERTRAAVLAAARARFASEGFDGATVASIASDAGVSEPTVAFHFGSKAGLLVAVIRDYYDDLLDALDAVIDPAAPPEQRLRDFARWWLHHNAENLSLLSVFGRQGRRSPRDEVVDTFLDANRRVTRVFDRLVEDLKHAGVLRPDVTTRIVRDAFFGTTEHLMLGRALTGRPDDLARAAEELVDLLFDGAATRSAVDDGPVTRADLRRLERRLDDALERLA